MILTELRRFETGSGEVEYKHKHFVGRTKKNKTFSAIFQFRKIIEPITDLGVKGMFGQFCPTNLKIQPVVNRRHEHRQGEAKFGVKTRDFI
ncbi:hypothetical protein [uncultured Desulfosarcina sp.]|uniref:hypothetical protein n=1 Tax=uncultured Desulfosarcina sp. TaxID=218289 RepID=UPI0029C615E3|nr:hypothetical protein [uncultured Desulfosarcina sp.]